MKGEDLLIDLSQFVCSPEKSGIQRVLVELICRWPEDIVSAAVGYHTSDDYTIVSLEAARSVFSRHFYGDFEAVSEAKPLLDRSARSKIPARHLNRYFSAYLMPELTFRDDVLDVLRRWNISQPQRTFAIFYDALPQTNPEYFRAQHQMATSRYYREITRIENVACISRASLVCLTDRLRRRAAPNAIIVTLGTNPFVLPASPGLPAKPTFLSIGSIEPRKNHPIILAAFDELWRSGFECKLHLIGAPRGHYDDFLRELSETMLANPRRFQWSQRSSDTDIQTALAQSTSLIFVSEGEGFGLPAVEALAAGCPLIAAASLPSLESLPSNGQIRLGEVTIESVKAAVLRIADPVFNAQLRSELKDLQLPKWQDFSHDLAAWIRRTLDGADADFMATASDAD